MHYSDSTKWNKLDRIVLLTFVSLMFFAGLGQFAGFMLWLVLGGVALFFTGFGYVLHMKRIQNTPTSKIRAIAMGDVEVYGEVEPVKGVLLKSPITEQDCVYYDYAVLKKSGKHMRTILRESRMVEFFLKDATGKVLVDPNGASVDIPTSVNMTVYGQFGQEPTEDIKRFLLKNKLTETNKFGQKVQMHFYERVIPPEENLFVMGVAGDNPYIDEGSANKSVVDIMLQKGSEEYHISTKSEKEMIGSLRLKAVLVVFGGPVMIITGLALIFLYMGML